MDTLFPEMEPPAPAGPSPDAPLADRMRPRTLEEFVGQRRILGEGSLLRRAIEQDALRSVIFWGPPGSGKTTLARIIAGRTRSHFISFSAVLSGIKEIKEVMREAEKHRARGARRTILFIDEIHRFNKAQQDAFLPFVEKGDIVLIGATTENPSFEVNAALLSRSKVCVLEMLAPAEIEEILRRALDDPRGLGGRGIVADEGVLAAIAGRAQGDARFALNALESAAAARHITLDVAKDALQKTALYHDKAGEEHFNLISALHKSMRSSDPDAALYWLARMIEGGEDPLYIARRIVRFASEDIGNADPRALSVAVAARDAFHFLGLPEGALALAQAAVYMAVAPKSDAVYRAYGEAEQDIREGKIEPVPLNIRNAPTGLMKGLGYGKGYQHAHDFEQGITDQSLLPPGLQDRVYYRPGDSGEEAEVSRRLDRRRELRRKRGARRKT
ncbi:MAG TPA: replication-associated recombination protein A [Candidatus Polarisedimenticolia bacterium]|nr:replication-associated recombination protein A [Candidatus Polarisedimenticolia bacterium]